jgi:hypothetical protein
MGKLVRNASRASRSLHVLQMAACFLLVQDLIVAS